VQCFTSPPTQYRLYEIHRRQGSEFAVIVIIINKRGAYSHIFTEWTMTEKPLVCCYRNRRQFYSEIFLNKHYRNGLQESRSNLHSVECHSTEWRFERLDFATQHLNGLILTWECLFVLATIFTLSVLKLYSYSQVDSTIERRSCNPPHVVITDDRCLIFAVVKNSN